MAADDNILELPGGFVFERDKYIKMRNSIVPSKPDENLMYQYFKGNAFTNAIKDDLASIRMMNAIQGEADDAKEKLEKYKLSTVDQLKEDLMKKRDEYSKVESQIFDALKANLKKLIKDNPKVGAVNKLRVQNQLLPRTPYPDDSVATKIAAWDGLFQINLTEFENGSNEIDLSGDPAAALYCFLRSQELYDEIKNIPEVRSWMSRRAFEEGLETDENLYIKNRTGLEKKMMTFFQASINEENSFIGTVVNNLQTNVVDNLIRAGMDADEASNMIIGFVKRSYTAKISGEKLKNSTTYRRWHDELSKWGKDIVVKINDRLKEKGLENYQIDHFEVKNGEVTFFTVDIPENAARLTSSAALSIKGSVNKFITSKAKGGVPFSLTILPHNTASVFTPETANAALKKQKTITPDVIEGYMVRGKKYLRSNSVIAGILGELSEYVNPAIQGLNAKITGDKQQMYKRRWDTQEASSGLSFSDMVIEHFELEDGGKIDLGFNIKNYVTNDTIFKLSPANLRGITVNNIHLYRYLSEDEIVLLKYVKANGRLMSKTLPDLEDAATRVMNDHLSEFFRIKSIKSDTVNYIIAANGHYIPASCIFQYAIDQLNNKYVPFEVQNTFLYLPKYSSDTKKQEIDVDNLMIDAISRARKNPLKYKFNEFTVNINHLLKL